ncbi:MAG: hypothetical protein ACTSXC_01535 [Candidatus Freyarchaeota archaeon]
MWRMVRPDSLKVWSNNVVLERLKRYYDVFNDKRPAKFLIASKVNIDVPLNSPTEMLWNVHERASKQFRRLLTKVDQGSVELGELDTPQTSYLDLKAELAKRILVSCHFCERRCGVNRLEGKLGFCKLGAKAYVSTAFLHMGEEAPLVPSGTIAG